MLIRRKSHVKRSNAPKKSAWNLSTPILAVSSEDILTIKDFCAGCCIWGCTGSGKSTGSAQAIARSFLSAGFGALVLCVKKSEADWWKQLAREQGREQDIVHIHPKADMHFDFLNYEMQREGGGQTENILELFMKVIEITQRTELDKGENAYFYHACKQLLRNAIDLCRMAYGRVSLRDIYQIVTSAPNSIEEMQSDEWKQTSRCYDALTRCNELEEQKQQQNGYRNNIELDLCANYFISEYPRFGDRLRSSISSIFTASADPWLRGQLRKLFVPEDEPEGFYLDPDNCKHGAIYLFDYPVKDGHLGRISQSLYKYMWQLHMERRNVEKDGGLPVFLWADEATHFLLPEQDAIFAQTARSSRILTVLISQNISNYYAALGSGEHGINQTESLMGNLSIQIFHANTHEKTNRWASSLFATQWQRVATVSSSDTGGYSAGEQGASASGSATSGLSMTEQQRNVVEPREFTMLANGGEEHDYLVEAIISQSGRLWNATGSNYLKTVFDQRYD